MPDIYILALAVVGTVALTCLACGVLWLVTELAVGYSHQICEWAVERWVGWRKRRQYRAWARRVRRRREAQKTK